MQGNLELIRESYNFDDFSRALGIKHSRRESTANSRGARIPLLYLFIETGAQRAKNAFKRSAEGPVLRRADYHRTCPTMTHVSSHFGNTKVCLRERLHRSCSRTSRVSLLTTLVHLHDSWLFP